ncbi:MAG TPA: PadR family transcriptional regulator [Streptosporangiaceae bacterium]|nr:PadR family transcriptional regulator [Streptosporangiaceae bacterium]
MTAGAASGACDLDAGLAGALKCANDVAAKIRNGFRAKASSKSEDGPWARDFGGRPGPGQWGGFGARPGPGHWGGGFGGHRRTAWWPGPPSAPPPKAGRGDVRAAILALLQEGPLNGYQIMSEIAQRSDGAWRPSPGAVYPALAQLADEGLITDEKSAGRRTYSLTDAGREYVAANPEKARGAWESVQQQESWQLPGLFSEAARLGSGVVQLAHAGTPAQVRAAERLLQQTRRELYRILASDTGAANGNDEDDDDDEPDN